MWSNAPMPSPEAAFSTRLRAALRLHGCDVVQVVDAAVPGPADLILEWPGHMAWVELKVDSPLRPEQRHFLRGRWARYRSAYLLRYCPDPPSYLLWAGDVPLQAGAELWAGRTLDIPAILCAIEACRVAHPQLPLL